MWLTCGPAFADRRIALVIGNSAYERVPQLANPVNDANAMAEMFRRGGFEVVQLKLDVKANEMRRALRDFSDESRNADFAIIYFAGHGIEIQGTNYLLPIDAVLERDIDAYDEAISLDRLLSVIEPARKLRLVILDACRDNPFARTMKHSVTASRGLERGLAKVEPMGPNTLIAYAAKAGSTAADGAARNSPFTAALVKHLPTPGLDLRLAFGYVRDEVLKMTHNRQEPFIYGSLGGTDVALVPKPQEPIVDPTTAARDDYELASQINVVAAWDSFIKKYPSGFYSDLARAQRDKLTAARATAAEQARLAVEKKSLDDAKSAEIKAAEIKAAQAERDRIAAEARAAEEARVAAAKKADEDARAAQAGQARIAAQVKAAADVRLALERQAHEQAQKPAPAKPDQVRPDNNTHLAAVLPGDMRLGQQVGKQEPRASAGCAGLSPQTVALSPDAAGALSLAQECALKPKDVFRECRNCPDMAVIPAGEFLMGSSTEEIGAGLAGANEAPQHKVALRQPIAIGRFEVTRNQYAAFVNSSGYRGSDRCFTFEQNIPRERENRSFLAPGYVQDGNHPAVCVSWDDAHAYVGWLSKTTGKPYRLPSEAEYEYAARADSTARFASSEDPADLCRFANGADQSAKTMGLPEDVSYMTCRDGYAFTAPVGSLAANAFGLYDLIGNVWEWTADCYAEDYSAAGSDSAPRAMPNCQARTVRGGDWFSTASSLRPAVRAKASPDAHHDDIGFRVVRILAH
jgi:formylglycine-generating enzyme required for sulfatase activity